MVEQNEVDELLNSHGDSEGSVGSDHSDHSDLDDKDDLEGGLELPWYQFNVLSFTMRVWDSFFALVVLFTLLFIPIAVVFHENFHDNEETTIDWMALDIFYEALWLIAFFINLNRVNPVLKIFKTQDTVMAYLVSPFLIPDAATLIATIVYTVQGDFH